MLVLRSNLWGLVVVMATIVQSGEKKRKEKVVRTEFEFWAQPV